MIHESDMGFQTVIKRFLIIFLPLASLITGITFIIYETELRNSRTIIESNERYLLPLLTQVIIGDFRSVISDMMILSEKNELQAMIRSREPAHRNALAKEFLSFSARKGCYDQIRFLDETGMEIVRINFNNGNAAIVSEDQLQFKGGRYYFDDAFRIGREEVFISPFDLNMEHGQIEQPLKPMIRFGTPVFDFYRQKRGIVLLNYFGSKIIHDLESAYINSPGQMMLLNRDGFWFKGPRPRDEWGFMYEDGKDRTFGNAFPGAWKQISGTDTGQFYDCGGLFTFSTVFPLSEIQTGSKQTLKSDVSKLTGSNYYWKVVSYIPGDTLDTLFRKAWNRLLLLNAVILPILGLCSAFLARAYIKREQAENRRRSLEQSLIKTNRRITDSIQYARLIQQSLLPNPENITAVFPKSFFIYMPRDIVGGDFIFTDYVGGGFIIAVIDCTGHGVPGAFITMIAAFCLRKIIKDESLHNPAQILNRLNCLVRTMLHQDTDKGLSDDGLDAAVCFISDFNPAEETEPGAFVLTFAGAKLPLVCIHNQEITVIRGDRKNIGYRKSDPKFKFANHTVNIEKGMAFYMFSDGFADQTGGERNRRLGTARLRNLLGENAGLPFEQQKENILKAFHVFRGNNEQCDDVTMVGFRF